MAATPEEVLNLALRRIGYPTPIGDIYDGSRASRVAVEIYAQERDSLLRAPNNWPFARQAVTLTLLKTAPVGGYGASQWTSVYPPPPWIFEYAYPDMCVDVRNVRPTPITIPEYLPLVHEFVVAFDNSLPIPAKVLLTNLGNAQAVITLQQNDPTQWESDFTEALVSALALRLQEALMPNPEAVKMRQIEVQTSEATAANQRG